MAGAVIGAGFASGREVAAFFSRFGAWSWVAVLAAVAALGGVSLGVMRSPGVPEPWRNRWPGRLWRGMFAALMAVAGGAMLAGAGEIAALTLPFHGAYWAGLAGTLLLAWTLAGREMAGMARLSRALTICLVVLMALGLRRLPEMRGVWVEDASVEKLLPESLLRGVCYGGFNAALACPVLDELACGMDARARRRCVGKGCAIVGGLLSLGNAVLTRHPALLGETLPFVRLMHCLGRGGAALGSAALYLAILTTLTACLRGLRSVAASRWTLLLPVGVALLGFTGAVDGLYPLLGGACFLMLTAKTIYGFGRKA